MKSAWDDEVDFIITGSGAASLTAATVMREAGLKALILEKTAMFGGSTAMSGGVIWIPDNPVMRRAGVSDSYNEAKSYLDACVGNVGPASSDAKRHAFLTQGPKVVEFLERRGMKFVHPEGYSDYHEGELPGGKSRSRSLVGAVFNARELGAWRTKLRRNSERDIPVSLAEIHDLAMNRRGLHSWLATLRVGIRLLRMKLGQDIVGTGGALQGRLLKIALASGVDLRMSSPVQELLTEQGAVVGVRAVVEGKSLRIRAKRGVLLNTGGFSHNEQMRKTYLPQPTNAEWTCANPGDTGDGIEMALALGASTALMDAAWWVSISILPNGTKLIHPFDMGKPFCIMVDQRGDRYVNEATSYVTVGNAMYAHNKTAPAVPSWMILESRHRNRYFWAAFAPGSPPKDWISSGYMKQADTIANLARQCNIEPPRLEATVQRFNDFARSGVDKDFHRGVSAYGYNWQGDRTIKPNGTLGAIEKPPFYAVRIFPGDVGTCGGLLTDEHGRVLGKDGGPILGLYATGNTTASLLGKSYPGAGASIGASLVFGWIAAHHAAKGYEQAVAPSFGNQVRTARETIDSCLAESPSLHR
jgi:3-oxosteroid 1-dehydrogenase